MREPRRSGRQRKVNPKYANDGWDQTTIQRLQELSHSPTSQSSSGHHTPGDVEESLLDAEMLHGKDSGISDHGSDVSAGSSKSSGWVTPADVADEYMNLHSDTEAQAAARQRPTLKHYSSAISQTTRSRGVRLSNDAAPSYANTFGTADEDLSDVYAARDTWLELRDITIPTRRTLAEAIKQASKTEEKDKDGDSHVLEVDHYLTLAQKLARSQSLSSAALEELYQKHLIDSRPSHEVVLGPESRQQKYKLDYLSVLDFGQAWPNQDVGASDTRTSETTKASRYHEGWLINVGEKVQCLAWAPEVGSMQYLAIAVRCTSRQRELAPADCGVGGQAFHPSPLYPSSIQIWAVSTKPIAEERVQTLAMGTEPRLVTVLATDWGDIRQLQWCPLDDTSSTKHSQQPNQTNPLGLLAVLSSDGRVRLVSVPQTVGQKQGQPHAYTIQQAAIDIAPPEHAIFTCLSFAGHRDLIVATSDGFIQLYDLSQCTATETLPSYWRHQVHHTYIISVCPAVPGPHCTLIASSSASGDLSLTDLRNPDQDRAHIVHATLPTKDLLYLPFTRSFISILDRSGNSSIERNAATFVVCHHIRQFPNILKIAKLSHLDGTATCLGSSKWHPCILVGNGRGQVRATNYLRKVLPYYKRQSQKAAGAYIQQVCEYDWRPLSVEERKVKQGESSTTTDDQIQEQVEAERINLYYGSSTRPGISRFREGFKPELVQVGNHEPSPRARKKGKKVDPEELAAGGAVFEMEQAVTAMEWNPNGQCAGLVAMGWGSGIVRVQDLSYDVQDGRGGG